MCPGLQRTYYVVKRSAVQNVANKIACINYIKSFRFWPWVKPHLPPRLADGCTNLRDYLARLGHEGILLPKRPEYRNDVHRRRLTKKRQG